jgi:hypothetical protein
MSGDGQIPYGAALHLAVGAVVQQTASAGGRKRAERKLAPGDDRPMLVRLLEKRLHLLGKGACSNLTVKVDNAPHGHRRIVLRSSGYGGGEDKVIAARSPGEPWHVVSDKLYNVAKDLGYRHEECFVCPDAAGKQWSDVRTHARSKPHTANVMRLVRAAVAALPAGYINNPWTVVDRG